MARRAHLFQTNFSQGEVSNLIEARPDVGKRANGALIVENCWILPEGGVFRRPGLKYICEVKDSSKFTLALPFEYDTSDAFAIEVSAGAFRFIKNRAQVISGPAPYEVANSYAEADLRDIHYEQSADFLFLTSLNAAVDVQKLARITDTNWTLANFNATPPPSFDADESLGVVGAISVNSGTALFRVSTDQFLAGDVNRQVIAGTGRALITAQTARQLTLTVLDNFSAAITAAFTSITTVGTAATSINHGLSVGDGVLLTSGAQAGEFRVVTAVGGPDAFTIDSVFSVDQTAQSYNKSAGFAVGAWFLRLAPQTTCDVNLKEPIGSQVNISMGAASLRNSYVGKFIKMLGGTIKILNVTGTTSGVGQIMSVLTDSTTADPAAVAAGAWQLQESSWSATRGRPRTVRTHQGRLVFYGTTTQPTTVWGSSFRDIYNFATGALATDAYEYTISGGKQNPGQWLQSLGNALYAGDAKQEFALRGAGADQPIGGDEAPLAKRISAVGSQHIQSLLVDNTIVMLHRSQHDVVQLTYLVSESADGDTFIPIELTLFNRQIGDEIFASHAPVFQPKPYSIVFFPMENGELAGLTLRPRQEISAWHRVATDGEIESVVVVPHENRHDFTVLCIVKRIINGQTKRYWEYFQENDSSVEARGWAELMTDCAKTGAILAGATNIGGLDHLEGEAVDVIIGATFIGSKTVSSGTVTLESSEAPVEDSVYEIGLHYKSTLKTLRPSIPNEITEGFKRSWPIVFVRVEDTIGGTLNGLPLKPVAGSNREYTGLVRLENVMTDDPYEGNLTLEQDEPYPFTVLGIVGRVQFADEMG